MDRVTASALRLAIAKPSPPAGYERLDEQRQSAGGHVVDGARGGLQGLQGARVVVVDAHQQLSGVEAQPLDVLGAVAGER